MLSLLKNEVTAMKKITILLTKYSDKVSPLIYYLTGRTYTHASLGIDGTYYSFNYKGFCTETVALHRKRGVEKSILYELNISDKSYQKICDQIQYFQQHKERFHYSCLGVVCCFFHIPFHRRDHYFCSQFVAEVLKRAGALTFKVTSELYLPSHFFRDLPENNQVVRIRPNPI